jgi:hypothetical protein
MRRTSIPGRKLTETEVFQLHVSFNVSSPSRCGAWLLLTAQLTTDAMWREVVFKGRLPAL